tara:strand:- start:240 stop:374 length:135 start_codon:yes stop_codon:yes gene_type:complete
MVIPCPVLFLAIYLEETGLQTDDAGDPVLRFFHGNSNLTRPSVV